MIFGDDGGNFGEIGPGQIDIENLMRQIMRSVQQVGDNPGPYQVIGILPEFQDYLDAIDPNDPFGVGNPTFSPGSTIAAAEAAAEAATCPCG